MENKLIAVGTKVLIKPDPVEEVSKGKIASIKVRKDSLLRGEIINFGSGADIAETAKGKFCYYTAYGYEEVMGFVLVEVEDIFALEE